MNFPDGKRGGEIDAPQSIAAAIFNAARHARTHAIQSRVGVEEEVEECEYDREVTHVIM